MSPERLAKIEEIFFAAIEIESGAKRARFLDEACAGDDELKKQVENLVLQDEEAGTFLLRPVAEESAMHAFADLLEDDPLVGENVGKYRIEREIGAGGMGAVYLAARADGSFEKRVAIKIVKRGMDTKFILRRFRQERQVLALLNHPFIAPLLDGGTTEDGLPYFVMEYVEGESLYKYADQNNLSVAARLRLFVKICSAVEYAHQNRVIHRDLKPSNILIKPDGSPRLLDFGIAKVFNPDFHGDFTIDPTQTAVKLMTPEYASPEQVKGETVSAASDIYSLGVVLFELLTGHRPYRFENRALHEIARVICEEEPDRPSTSVTREDNLLPKNASEATTLADVFRVRGAASLESLQKELSGEIEKVILKCLRKKADQRYGTVAALIEDITRFLSGEAVRAETFYSTAETAATIIAEKKSIAVLPLKMPGGAKSAEDEYLGIGLADALVSRLSNLARFIVRPTSSVLKFQAAETIDSFAAGHELAVEFVVEGTIRRVGERIRVSIKLLSVSEKATRWAESFDERMTDVLEIEDSISERVAATLVPRLTGEEQKQIAKRGTDNAEAYQAYLRGRYFWNQFTPDALPKALEAFEKAVALDPHYAAAYAGIADFYNWATNFGFIPPRVGNEKMRAAAARALEIDPHLPEALAAMGLVKAFFDYEWTEAERLFRRSIEINPHQAATYERYTAMLNALGRMDEAGERAALAGKLDPLSIRSVTLFAWNFYQQRRFAEALARADEVIELNPRYFLGRILRGNILVEAGRAAEAIPEIEYGIELEPRVPLGYYMLCFAHAALGQTEAARRALRDLENLPGAFASAYHLGLCSIALGDRDAAFEWLDKAIDARQTLVAYFATDPKFDSVRDDERFNELLRKTNRRALARETKSPPKTFAVLPFRTLTGGAEEERFLGIGLADALITRLSPVKNLVVRPTSSVVRYTDESIESAQAGRELRVAYLLEGSVRRVGSRVRVSAQLFDVGNGSTVWAERFDENFTDIFALEDAVAGRVAAILLPKLTGDERRRIARRPTDSPAAYEAYLRGRYHLYQVAPTEFAKAKMYFEEAIRHDADYALAYVGLAEYCFIVTAFAPVPSAENLIIGREMAKRALEIDDSLGEVWAVYAFFSQASLEEVEQILERSVRLSPHHSLARVYRSGLYIVQRRFDEAVAEARLAVELNPLSAFEQTHLTWILYQARRFEESIAAGEKSVADNPQFSLGYGVLSHVLAHVGKTEAAINAARRGAELNPDSPTILCSLATAHAKAGESEKAREILQELLAMRKSKPFSPFDLAILHLNLGDRDAAFAELQNALLDRVPQLLWLGSEPELDPLRQDERFLKLLQMMQARRAPKK